MNSNKPHKTYSLNKEDVLLKPIFIKHPYHKPFKKKLLEFKPWFKTDAELELVSELIQAQIEKRIQVSLQKEETTFFKIPIKNIDYSIQLLFDDQHQQCILNLSKRVSEKSNTETSKQHINWMFDQIFDKIPFDIAIYDDKLRYFNVSSSAIKNPEVRQWIIGKTDIEYCKHYQKNIAIGRSRTKLILQAKQTKAPVEFIEQNKLADGSMMYTKKNIFPVFNSKGKITNYLGFSNNVTAENIFKENITSILSSIEDVVFEINDRYIFTNAWASNDSNFIIPKHNFIGKRLNIVLGKLGKQFEHSIKEVIETGEIKTIDYKHPSKEVYFQSRISLIKQTLNHPEKKVVVSVRNTTSIVEKDKILHNNKSFLEAIINYSDDIIFSIDTNYNILSSNSAFHKTFQKINSIDQHSFFNYIPLEEKEIWLNYFQKLKSKKTKETSVSFQNIHAESNIKIEYHLTPIKDSNNKLSSILILGRNITKLLELNFKLLQAKINAEEAMKMKEQFLFNMSHEIRTPLNSIAGALHLLEDNTTDTTLLSYIATIKNSSSHLLGLLNDILDLSKIKTGKIKIINNKLNINQLIHDTISTFSVEAKRKRITIDHISKIPDSIHIVTDEVRLRQVLFNIIGNSMKFTPKGKIEVYSKLTKTDTELEITIKDTGIGIEKNRLDKIFNGIVTKNRITNPNEGAGLGLNISMRLVELLKGSITVQSELGKGTAFTIKIPTKKVIVKQKETQESLKKLSISKQFNGERILVAEDHEFNRFFLTSLLKDKKLQVDAVGNGLQAITMIKKNKYDLILMDLSMPKMDGFKATEQIRNILHHTTPILAITAHTQRKVYNDCIKAGMNGVVKKPYNPVQLFSKIKSTIQKHKTK